MYTRPANAVNTHLWERACENNPDPSCMVPVLAVGFEDLEKRSANQRQDVELHQEALKVSRLRKGRGEGRGRGEGGGMMRCPP